MKKTITVILLTTLVVLDEKIISAEQDDYMSTKTDDTTDREFGAEEELFLFLIFSFFALCISLFGSGLLYVSYCDDRVMKKYADEGILIEGKVVATEFTRGGDTNAIKFGNYSSRREYFVSIEYSFLLSENYPIRIRKQLRVLECDFCQPDRNSSCPENKKNSIIEIIASRDSFFRSFQFDHGKKIQLLVLPDHHLSALPTCQVKRRLSTKYRLFSITFVIIAILIAVFLFRFAVSLLWRRTNEEEEMETNGFMSKHPTILSSLLVNIVFAMLALAPIPCIHYCLHDCIQYSLEEEYFEMGGNIIKGGHDYDDSSLSSRSDFAWSPTPSYFGSKVTGLETQSTLG